MDDELKKFLTIAHYLDGKWRYNPVQSKEKHGGDWYFCATFTNDDEPSQAFRLGSNWGQDGKHSIKGRSDHGYKTKTPGHCGGFTIGPKINISKSRTAKSIAQDINRRFLKEYQATWAKFKADDLDRTARRDKQRLRFDLLKSMDPTLRPRCGNSSVEFDFKRGSMQLYDHGPRLTLSLTFDQIAKVFYFINTPEFKDQ